ncbi:DUF4272 domain-containing protein [Dyella subtropica]|uniref:DUF4272 domain-containing protein n=1 Tax=Dyella subtropica TaxID=2992127 RepID=UPI002254C807|nr:DUF4272 domain-containing protein [Dyella subtropica]
MTTVTPVDAAARKSRSEAHLVQMGIPIDPSSPPLELSASVRPPEAIPARAICLCLCAAKAEGLDPATVASLVTNFHVGRYLRPPEVEFLYGTADASDQVNRFQWGYEACWALLWVLGRLETLDDPVARCDPQQAARIITTSGSITGLIGTLRSNDEIFDVADLTHRFLDACRQAGPPYENLPGELICPVVYQRQLAFQWLLDPAGTRWEEIIVPI